MYNHNKAQQSKNRVHISWDILYMDMGQLKLNNVLMFDGKKNITWINVDQTWNLFCGINLRIISHEVNLVRNVCSDITL